MDSYTKALIERRALQLAKVCERLLLEQEADDIAAAGFRWGYLILRKPKRYLEEFRHGTLLIDPDALRDSFWFNQEVIEGPAGLMPEEELILKEFNDEATAWMKNNSKVISLVRTEHNTYR
ncbi:MAG: hypothetical protein KF802_14705 [Bdellovibrionaceae bacterium]|nr:hypothetical protein [Pseudobdellovibrionaceae bacterium]